METCKASLDKWDLSRMICTIRRSETDRVCLSFFPAHYFQIHPTASGAALRPRSFCGCGAPFLCFGSSSDRSSRLAAKGDPPYNCEAGNGVYLLKHQSKELF